MGLGVAQAFAARGIGVALWDVNIAGAKTAADDISASDGQARAYEVDVANAAQVNDAAQRATVDLGPITILINCAGANAPMSLLDHTEAVFDRLYNINMKGPFNCIQAVVPGMVAAQRGAIVNIASVAAQTGGYSAAYSATKAGVLGLTKSVAAEFGRKGITCNCICPGPIDTPMLRGALGKAASLAGGLDALKAQIAVGRIGTVADIAATCLYLTSEDATFITGQILGVSGGQYM
jgi:NAD(P)-dependent dehydrogenase (short-subunit alcohol dehydrogenase family)